jgi:hypothetical protein
MTGAPRIPRKITISDNSQKSEIQKMLPESEIIIGETPELNELVKIMGDSLSQGNQEISYLEDGEISKQKIKEMFKTSSDLYKLAPWRHVTDNQVLKLDIPHFKINNFIISIIGMMSESFGYLIFSSEKHYQIYRDMGLQFEKDGFDENNIDLGGEVLGLNFDNGFEIPDNMRKEIIINKCSLDDSSGYPLVERRNKEGLPMKLNNNDIRIVIACNNGLVKFMRKHKEIFSKKSCKSTKETAKWEKNKEVTISTPF